MHTIDHQAIELIEEGRREFALQLWRHIPPDGAPIGNIKLRRLSKTTSAPRYWDTRNAMAAAGLVALGGGKGGSVRRTEQYVDAEALPANEPTTGLELRLYDGIMQQLKVIVEDEARFRDHVIDKTGLQGSRRTGGRWSRPDLTLVGMRRFNVLAGTYLEVQTFEIKTADGFDLAALHEARAHRRRAHRSYVVVDLESEDDEYRVVDLVDEARDLGVGLISFVATDNEWNCWHEPELVLPDPVDLDMFLDTQLSASAKERIRGWQAMPAMGGSE